MGFLTRGKERVGSSAPGVMACVAIVACMVGVLLARQPAKAGEPRRDRFDSVIIDAGHGGHDEGAEGKETLKFWVSDGETTVSAVGFRMGKYQDSVSLGQKIDLAYQISIDDWNKAPQVQLKLKDIKVSVV